MKKTIILTPLSLLLASQTFAADCKLNASVYEGFHCMIILTKFKVENLKQCEDLVEEGRTSRFFNIMGKKDVLLGIKMTYKQKNPSKKVVQRNWYEDTDDYCY